MTSTKEATDKKKVIEAICAETEASKNERIWGDYVNALKLISQVVFTRSSGFLLEMIQNAEDAGQGSKERGLFSVTINKKRVKITHNGRPFTEGDVRALCGIRSSKKPEKGTLGYLGIGFKSVFKITDRPEIYSNGFQFMFDRGAWPKPAETPWHVLPIWIKEPSENNIDLSQTTFIFPFREESAYDSLIENISELGTHLYLFLQWLKTIEFIDEDENTKVILQNLGEKDDVTVLRQGNKEKRFKFFRKQVEVPEHVKQDRLSQEYRANVNLREIAISFPLDQKGNLVPQEATTSYGGVYSFVPLGESRSGVRFPVQADFLVQPGRDAINYEAAWNHWLLDEVVELCKIAIERFKRHDVWKYQFMPMFEFSKETWLESYQKLFGPKLIEPLENFLANTACIPTSDGGWALPKDVVQIDETVDAIQDLLKSGLVAESDIGRAFGERPDLRVAHPNYLDRNKGALTTVDRSSFLANKDYLQERAKSPEAVGWFRSLYQWLDNNPVSETYFPSSGFGSRRGVLRTKGYYDVSIVLTTDLTLHHGGKVNILDSPASLATLKLLEELTNSSRHVLHPDILSGVSDGETRNELRGFLMGRAGVQQLDAKAICKEEVLPKILSTSTEPGSADLLLRLTSCCQVLIGSDLGEGNVIWCLTKRGEIRHANEVLLGVEFEPDLEWEKHLTYVSGLNFVSQRYIRNTNDRDEAKAWKAFFKAGGIQFEPNRGVEEFAVKYATEKLSSRYKSVSSVEPRNYGYDLEAKNGEDHTDRVEVKGLTEEHDVELSSNETEAADNYREHYFLCVVTGIPNKPQMYLVPDPVNVGRKDKLTVTSAIWRAGERFAV